MASSGIEELLRRAESDPEDDTSINSAERQFPSDEAASRAFDDASRRLLDIRQWQKSSTPSSYELFEESGRQVSGRPISEGDFIRISVSFGGKYDWVRVMSIERSANEMVVTVKPTFDPTEQPQQKDKISHFFRPDATNNFCLQRRGSRLTMSVIGLDEKTNTEFADGLLEAARNVAAANLGSYLGAQKALWKEFCNNFLSVYDEESE